MTNEQRFKELLSRLHREILKPAGFKKEGGNFRLVHDNGLCKIINFQRSMFNYHAECRFCINVGLYIQPDPENPNLRFKEYECSVRNRVRHNLEECMDPIYSTDQWWSIFEGQDMEKLYVEVKAILTTSTLPWLNQFENRQDVIRAGQKGMLKGMISKNI